MVVPSGLQRGCPSEAAPLVRRTASPVAASTRQRRPGRSYVKPVALSMYMSRSIWRMSLSGGASGARSGFVTRLLAALTTHNPRPAPAPPPRRSPALGGPLLRPPGPARLPARAAGLQDARAVADEGQRATVRAPARRGVALPPPRQLAGRPRALGRHAPQGVAVAVASGRDRAQREDDGRAVGRDADLGRDAQVEEVFRARGARHAGAPLAGRGGRGNSLTKP